MLFDEDRVTEAQKSQLQRCVAFGAMTAEKIRAAENCRFSLLPHEALARLASSWYGASAQAMLNSNYAPIHNWTQVQSQLAAEEQFHLEDVLELLRICRSVAIQKEKWSEDIFSIVDDAINEALVSVAPEVAWTIPRTLDYLSVSGIEARTSRAGAHCAKFIQHGSPRATGRTARNLVGQLVGRSPEFWPKLPAPAHSGTNCRPAGLSRRDYSYPECFAQRPLFSDAKVDLLTGDGVEGDVSLLDRTRGHQSRVWRQHRAHGSHERRLRRRSRRIHRKPRPKVTGLTGQSPFRKPHIRL